MIEIRKYDYTDGKNIIGFVDHKLKICHSLTFKSFYDIEFLKNAYKKFELNAKNVKVLISYEE